MNLPPVPVNPSSVLNEYVRINSELTAENIKLKLMVQLLWEDRNDALHNWEICAKELQELRRTQEQGTVIE